MLLTIALRNIGRNKRRSALTALAIGFSFGLLLFSMALQRGSYVDMIQNTVRVQTGHLQIQRTGYWPERLLQEKLDPAGLIELASREPQVIGVTPRVSAAALVSKDDHTFGALVLGIDPEREPSVSSLRQNMQRGEFLPADDTSGALLGEALAGNLGASPGDEVIFVGQGADGSMAAARLVVRGVFKVGLADLDRSMLVAHIRAIQEAFSMESNVTEIAILLDNERNRPAATLRLRNALVEAGRTDAVVLGWSELMPGVEQSMAVDWNSGLIIYAALVLVVGLGIANTFLMAYMERTHELGVMLAMGMPPRRLSWMVYLESMVLLTAGLCVGLVAGVPLTLYFQGRGIDFGVSEDLTSRYIMSAVIHPRLEPLVFNWAGGIVVFVTLLVAVYPAIKAGRIRPVEAIRRA